ncbi:MAG: YybS family protein [Micrococcales bacterium]|nr:YybS family protein [Micrococcales bacterium]
MTAPTSARGITPAIDRYLAELDERSTYLPSDERAEIISSVEDHIVDELDGDTHPDPGRVRDILTGLGPVSELLPTPPASAAPTSVTRSGLGIAGVLLGIAGLLVLVFFPPLGLALGIGALVIGLVLRHRPERKLGLAALWLGIAAVVSVGVLALVAVLGFVSISDSHVSPPAPAVQISSDAP